METIEISGVLGLIAVILLTLNILMGIMLSTGYKQTSYWEKLPPKFKAFKIIDIHNYTAYAALCLVLFHVLLIPLDPSSKFTFKDVIWPIHAPHQALFVAFGTLAFIALVIVIITTQKVIKRKLGTTVWRSIHVISYATGLLFIVHGLVMDPLLKDRPIDFIDPEKLLVEFCAIILMAAFIFRYRYKIAKNK